MPEPARELALAELYRRTSLALRAAFLRDYVVLFRALDLTDSAAYAPWLRLAVVLVRQYRAQSATLARLYVEQARTLGVGAPPGITLDLPQLDDDVVVRNLLATGPGAYSRSRAKGRTDEQARARALVASQGAASRLVLDGGRDYVDRMVAADPQAVGYMRVTDGDPCAFCAMLASRGTVERGSLYRSRESAGYVEDARGPANRFHDDCGCQVVPVYSRQAALPATSQRFDRLWRDATAGLPRSEALNAFRRAVEGRSREGDPLHRQQPLAA